MAAIIPLLLRGRIVARTKTTRRHQTTFDSRDHFVQPPGRGVAARVISFRITPDLADAIEALWQARPAGHDEPYFDPSLYRSPSDIHRALIYQGYLYIKAAMQDEALDRESALLVAAQKSIATGIKIASVARVAESLEAVLRNLIAVGAKEEAQQTWVQQWEIAQGLEGYAKRTILNVLGKFPQFKS